MKDDFFLKEENVDISINKLITYIEDENQIIEEFSNLIFNEFNFAYKSSFNSKVNQLGATFISKLNNMYKDNLDNYMYIRNEFNSIAEIKNRNISNFIEKEEGLK